MRIIENAELIYEFDMDFFFTIIKGNRFIVTLLDYTEIEVLIE